MSWNASDLASVVSTLESGSRPQGGASPSSGEIPSLGGENILRNGGITLNGVKRVPREFYERMTKGHLADADVLINKDGAQTGKVGLYRNQNGSPLCINEHLFLIRGNAEKIAQEFLYYTLLSSLGQNQINTQISGSAQPGLKSDFLHGIFVEIPDAISEQLKISEILLTVDQAIEQTEALIAKQQRIKTGLMHDLFTRGVTPDGRLRPPREEAPQLYKESPLGWIPKAWDYEHLSKLTTRIVDGVHHTPTYMEHGVPFVTVKNLTCSRSIDFSDLNYISRRDHQEFLRRADPQLGDVLVTKDGTLGVSRLVEPWHPEFSIFVSVAMLRPIVMRLRPHMLHMFFNCGAYERQLGHLSVGTGLKHIHLEHFRRFVIPLPDGPEQDRIALAASSIEGKLMEEEQISAKLQMLKRGLMHDLLTGKVSVTPLLAEAEVGA